jgi:hypothetical protein
MAAPIPPDKISEVYSLGGRPKLTPWTQEGAVPSNLGPFYPPSGGVPPAQAGRIFKRSSVLNPVTGLRDGEIVLNTQSGAERTDTYVYPTSSADVLGPRTYFDPVLNAFRVGATTGDQWDRSVAGRVGQDSVAIGVDGVAGGTASVVLGTAATVEPYALMWGGDPTARAAMQSQTSGPNQVTLSTGELHVYTDTWTAGPSGATAGGVYLDAAEVRATNALVGATLRSDAPPTATTGGAVEVRARSAQPASLTDSGTYWVRADAPDFVPAFTDNNGNTTILTGGAPAGVFFNQAGAPTTTVQASGDATNDFSFGSLEMEFPPGTETNRFLFDKSAGAFRAGVAGAQWNAANRGAASAAFGTDNTASGVSSFAAGDTNIASGDRSTALGSNQTASGDDSLAVGLGHTVSGAAGTALGDTNTVAGQNSLVGGRQGADAGFDNCLVWSNAPGSIQPTANDQVVLNGACFFNGPVSVVGGAAALSLDGPTGSTTVTTAATTDYAIELPAGAPTQKDMMLVVDTLGPVNTLKWDLVPDESTFKKLFLEGTSAVNLTELTTAATTPYGIQLPAVGPTDPDQVLLTVAVGTPTTTKWGFVPPVSSFTSLVLQEAGTPANTTTLSTASTAPYNIRFPTVAPAAAGQQALVTKVAPDAVNELDWKNVAVDGGNALGATLTVGTTDAQSLELVTSGATAVTVAATGAVTTAAGLTVTGSITAGGATPNPAVSTLALLSARVRTIVVTTTPRPVTNEESGAYFELGVGAGAVELPAPVSAGVHYIFENNDGTAKTIDLRTTIGAPVFRALGAATWPITTPTLTDYPNPGTPFSDGITSGTSRDIIHLMFDGNNWVGLGVASGWAAVIL